MRNCVTCGGPDPTSMGHGFEACIRYLASERRNLWEESAKKHGEISAIAFQLRELREAKAAPIVPVWTCKGLVAMKRCTLMQGHPGECMTNNAPPAPPFKLGPHTMKYLYDADDRGDSGWKTTAVARETARLIAEWLRHRADPLASHQIRYQTLMDEADNIERGLWGKE